MTGKLLFCSYRQRELLAYDFGAGTEYVEFASRNRARKRGHPAIGAGIELVGIHKLERLSQSVSHFLRCLDGVGGDIGPVTLSCRP